MEDLIGRIVEVVTVESLYRGRLVEINEQEVYLQAESGWIVVQVERIASIREPED